MYACTLGGIGGVMSTWSWHRLASSSSSRMAFTRISSDTMARILPTMSLLCRKSDMQAKFMLAWMVACVRGSRISHTTGRSSTALPLPVVPPGTSAVSPDVAAALRDWLGCLLSSGNSSFAAPSRVCKTRKQQKACQDGRQRRATSKARGIRDRNIKSCKNHNRCTEVSHV